MQMGIESKLTAKGQTTIPLEVREHLGIGPGDMVRYVIDGERVEVVPRNRPASSIFGLLADYAIPGTSLEDYKSAVADAIAERQSGGSSVKSGEAQ
jgi:antitoxin PrlF